MRLKGCPSWRRGRERAAGRDGNGKGTKQPHTLGRPMDLTGQWWPGLEVESDRSCGTRTTKDDEFVDVREQAQSVCNLDECGDGGTVILKHIISWWSKASEWQDLTVSACSLSVVRLWVENVWRAPPYVEAGMGPDITQMSGGGPVARW
jgi:hypothetical protein